MRKNTSHKYLRGIHKGFIKSLKNHFFKYIIIPENDSHCMEWNSYINPQGYGKIYHNGKSYRAHRLSYQIFIGLIPKNMEICHLCDNTKCINPNHLFLGSHSENMKDMSNKNRHKVLKGSKNKLSKFNEEDILDIRRRLDGNESQKNIAKDFDVYQTTISKIKLNKSWRHVK